MTTGHEIENLRASVWIVISRSFKRTTCRFHENEVAFGTFKFFYYRNEEGNDVTINSRLNSNLCGSHIQRF